MQIVPQAFYLILVILLVAAAVSDLKQYVIPNWIPLAILALFPLYIIGLYFFGPEGVEVQWLASLAVAAIVFVIFVAMFALGVIGGGDVKLIGATSLWAGPELIAAFFIITALVGGVLALVFLVISKRRGGGPSRAREETETPAEQFKPGQNAAEQSDTEAGPETETASVSVSGPEKAGIQIPYGVAIACGGIFISGKQIINHFSQ